jgi:hypothetical protein
MLSRASDPMPIWDENKISCASPENKLFRPSNRCSGEVNSLFGKVQGIDRKPFTLPRNLVPASAVGSRNQRISLMFSLVARNFKGHAGSAGGVSRRGRLRFGRKEPTGDGWARRMRVARGPGRLAAVWPNKANRH